MPARSSRSLWTVKLTGKGGTIPQARATPSGFGRASFQGRILGIDPSLRSSGLVILNVHPNQQYQLEHHSRVRPKTTHGLHGCIHRLSLALESILNTYQPNHIALEQSIYVQNMQVAQTLGAVKGAIISVASMHGFPIFEYAPLRIKQAITGRGRATKEQVRAMGLKLLGSAHSDLTLDESDALAVAFCHAFTYRI